LAKSDASDGTQRVKIQKKLEKCQVPVEPVIKPGLDTCENSKPKADANDKSSFDTWNGFIKHGTEPGDIKSFDEW